MPDRSAIDNPASYAAEELLRDGGSILIRAIRPADKALLLEHFNRLSALSRYRRFLGPKTGLSEQELRHLTELDFHQHAALVAVLREGERERLIGVGRYIRQDSEPRRAEVAFAVLDEYQGRGIGTLLLDHLSRLARASAITEFEADVLGDNSQMIEVFTHSGFHVRRFFDSGVVHVSFPTGETEELREASLARERRAAARSVERLVRPASVAVVGASRLPDKIGGAIVANLKNGGFTGAIYPINPAAGQIHGFKAYPTVSAVGAPIDLAVIALPAAQVEQAILDCARAGVHGVVVISAGFAEVSPQGAALEQRLFELVRSSGMRMVGPNCLGVINTDPQVRLDATFAPILPTRGNIGMVSQSGALGIAILDHLRERNLGISTFVSIGNRADLSNNDLLAYWTEDPQTAVVMLYMESVGNPRTFARLAPELARLKPVVAVKSGRSTAGQRAAQSHSAALATLDVAVDALFEQAGVIRTATLEELFDVCALLSAQPIPPGPRVGVVTNAGGPGILFADACEAHGLLLPGLSTATVERLREFLPAQSGFANPVDMTAQVTAAHFEQAVAAVGNDPAVDTLVAIYIPPMVTRPEEVAAAIARGAGAVAAEKPVLSVFLAARGWPPALAQGPHGPIPSFTFPENAALALAKAHRYARWRARPRGTPLNLTPFAHSAVRAIIDRALKDATKPRWLAPAELAGLLRAAQISFAPAEVTTVEEAEAAAQRLGYPLVAKIVAPGAPHKSEIGGVIMDLKSAAEVAAAARTLQARTQKAAIELTGILLQRQIGEGIEFMVGATADPTLGPLLLCGVGGRAVELLGDVALRLHPVTDIDAGEMIAQLRSRRLLEGFRGAPPGDRQALAAVIMKVSALVEAIPELLELDLNPIKVLPPGDGAVVVDARMRVAPPARRLNVPPA